MGPAGGVTPAGEGLVTYLRPSTSTDPCNDSKDLQGEACHPVASGSVYGGRFWPVRRSIGERSAEAHGDPVTHGAGRPSDPIGSSTFLPALRDDQRGLLLTALGYAHR